MFSILYPEKKENGSGQTIEEIKKNEKVMSDTTLHDLGLDAICKGLSNKEQEQVYILRTMAKMTSDVHTAKYRGEIFEDIYRNPSLRKEMMDILDKIDFLRDYGSFKRDREEAASMWELVHRLEEINDYISCVEALQKCLSSIDIKSEGLIELKNYIDGIYKDNAFAELKKDIKDMKGSTSDLKSVTLGVNLNDRFEAESIGLISINNKSFTKSGVIGGFSDMITAHRGGVKEGNDWKDDYKYHPFSGEGVNLTAGAENVARASLVASNPLAAVTLAGIPTGDVSGDVSKYMDRIVNHMLSITVKRLKDTLNKYINITITNITNLIPEFMYYIRWAEYIDKLAAGGMRFAKADPVGCGKAGENGAENAKESAAAENSRQNAVYAEARAIYNLKLASAHLQDGEKIITNDLTFSNENQVYILTGANRGGKTTITQAIGLLFALAQGGIYIPGDGFEFAPVDCIYTHFPADEDKTMDLGRLGEECKRFREIYSEATDKSLLLLNETFSTTSFEEGYYIARDSVKALLKKGARTIYNTHMHKLAYEIDEINSEAHACDNAITAGDEVILNAAAAGGDGKEAEVGFARSLIVCSDGGDRSFKIMVAPPEGMSYAADIAKKYGVTYELLTGGREK